MIIYSHTRFIHRDSALIKCLINPAVQEELCSDMMCFR